MAQWSNATAQLAVAVDELLKKGATFGVERWIERELDSMGRPHRIPVEEWSECLSLLLAMTSGVQLGEASRYRIVGFLTTALRFTRPDGGRIFGSIDPGRGELAELARNIERVGDASLARVLSWWKPRKGDIPATTPPPLPFDHRHDRACSILRADWTKSADWVAIDHRSPGPTTRFELAIGGRPILGPTWGVSTVGTANSAAKVIHARSGPYADHIEWSVRSEGRTIIRTAIVLRGRKIGLLAEQYDRGGGDLRIGLAEATAYTPSEIDRSLRLRPARTGPTASLIPLAQPADRTRTEAGAFEVDASGISMGSVGTSRRIWNPLLVSWGKPPTFWRQLTVSERSKACPSDVAFAARVAWGARDDGLVIYRSLIKPGLRAFLGHQTRASLLIGRIDPEGRVVPIYSMD